MKKNIIFVIALLSLFFVPGAWAQPGAAADSETLAPDIPEPADAQQELPSPVPFIYEFMAGVMAGDQDKCLVNFHVRTFLTMLYGEQMKELQDSEDREIYSYQTQVQRNEFRYLSKIMNRIAKEAKLHYSNPRFNQKRQAKIVIKIKTLEKEHEFVVYCRYVEDKWQVYDYVLNNRRFSDAFKAGLGAMKIVDYIANLRPLYGMTTKLKPFANEDFGLSIKLPDFFKVKEKISQSLLYSVSAFEGQFLMHVQAAVYQQPRTLNQAAAEIRETILPFKPKLFDQWRSEIAGIEMGQVIFQFEKNGKMLFTHMVIIPMAEKLLVLNFYHNSFQLLKNLSNVRDKILDNVKLAKLAGSAGEIVIPADDASLSNQTPTELPPYTDGQQPPSDPNAEPTTEPTPEPSGTGEPPTNGGVEEPPPPPPDDQEIPPPPPEDEEPSGDVDENGNPKPPQDGQGGDQKNPKQPADNGSGDEVPPPPPPEEQEIPPADESGEAPEGDGGEVPPPPPPPDEGGGKDVSF